MIPDYYLSSLEDVRFYQKTHECYVVKSIHLISKQEGVIVRVFPLIIGQLFGLGGTDVEYIVLTCDIEKNKIHPPSVFPFLVNISFLLSYDPDVEIFNMNNMIFRLSGEIYKTRHDAENHIFPQNYKC